MFPGQREVSTGDTASAWHPASVRRFTLAAHFLHSDFFFRLAAGAVKLNLSAVRLPFYLLLRGYCRRCVQRESVRRGVRRDRRHVGEGAQHRPDDAVTVQVGSEPIKIEVGL